MKFERAIVRAVVCIALAVAASRAPAAPAESLVVTRLPDPDPRFIPLPRSSHATARSSGEVSQDAQLDEAMQDFSRAIGQLTLVEQQQIDAKCKAGVPADDASLEQRFAWAASCRYSRH